MNIKAISPGKAEKKVKLSELNPGDVFRFPDVSFEEAISSAHDATFYMVIEITPKKAGRVSCVSVDGKNILERDEDRIVIHHKAELLIQPAKKEQL